MKEIEPNIHEGHRKRLKERFKADSMRLNGFEPHAALELLLFYAIPQRDTNAIAHALIREFGSFSAVLEADFESLVAVRGVGENAALLIKLVFASFKMYDTNKKLPSKILDSVETAGEYVSSLFYAETREIFKVLCIDNKGAVKFVGDIDAGSASSVNVSPRKVVETAIRQNCDSIILAHNHPGGLAVPSAEDVKTTADIIALLKNLGITVLDHFIAADNEVFSMADSKKFAKMFE